MKCTAVIEVRYPRNVLGQEPCPDDAVRGGYCLEHYNMHVEALKAFGVVEGATIKQERFYFWEDVKVFDGVRCMGALTGYGTIEECEEANQYAIERNKAHGYPCWIAKSTVVKVLTEARC